MTSERTSEQNFKLNYISKDTMKAIKHLLWMLIALSMSISFAACGGDDNNDGNQDIPTPAPGPGEGASELVGKWETVESGQTIGWGWLLKADGTGTGFEADINPVYVHGTWPIRWKYKNNILDIDEGCEGLEEDFLSYRVDYISETVMRCTDLDEFGKPTTRKITFKKVDKFFWE